MLLDTCVIIRNNSIMKNLLNKIKKVVKLVKAFFPSPVPNGMKEFDTWSLDIIDTYNFPNNDSIRSALAVMIMHDGPTAAYRSKFHWSLMIKASMAKQIASGQFQEIKNRQKAQAELLAAQEVKAVPSESQQQTVS